jgi:putative ABC transport system permease protein
MMRWTVKSLLHEPAAFLGSAAAVAAAFVLVMLFEAIWAGESAQVVAYARHAGADVWVMQRGVSNMHMATSLIPIWKADQVARIEGVSQSTPILYLNSLVRAGERDWFAYVVGLQDDAPFGGAWSILEGQADPRRGEAVFPEVMSRLTGVGLGDEIRIADKPLRVSGLSRDTFSMANPVLFVHAADLTDILGSTGYDSYVLVKSAPGIEPGELASAIEAGVEDVEAMTQADFVESDHRMATQMGVELIGLMTFIGGSLAALLIAFTLYTHTARKRRELAILKALGFHNRQVFAGVLLQAAILALIGFLAGVGLAYAIIMAASVGAPQIAMSMTTTILAKVGAGGTLVAMLSTVVPAWQIVRVDPQTVFQS